jgi:hypothetical protein
VCLALKSCLVHPNIRSKKRNREVEGAGFAA